MRASLGERLGEAGRADGGCTVSLGVCFHVFAQDCFLNCIYVLPCQGESASGDGDVERHGVAKVLGSGSAQWRGGTDGSF